MLNFGIFKSILLSKTRSTIERKEGKEFSVVLFYQLVYHFVKLLLANANLTNH